MAAQSPDYNRVAEEAIKTRTEWFAQTDWSTFHDANGIKLELKRLPTSSIDVIRSCTILHNVDIERIKDFYFGAGFEEKKKIDPDLIEHRVVQNITDNVLITHSRYAPNLIANREFVALRSVRQIPNGYIIAIHSIDYPGITPPYGVVRGLSFCGTLLERLDGNRVRIRTVDHIEPQGWVPSFIVNSFRMKVADKLRRIQQVYAV